MNRKKNYPKRLRREESFLGIHFDYHMSSECTEVGKTVTRGMVKRIINLVQPDYIQVDCKGHSGLSSYPTKVGSPAPGFVRDQLQIWRDVTAEYGVALYVHYSGVADDTAVKKHPSWARVDENGKRDVRSTSVFSPYVDKLLIPQLREVADKYDIDGVWVDGECWAVFRDYSKKALSDFRKQTGIHSIPRKPSDRYFFEFTEFCREGFRAYLKRYVTELHKHCPGLQVASNFAFTSLMPEPVGIEVDFLSGDSILQNAVNFVRLESRIMARQGKSWDLMAWGFSGKYEEGSFFNTRTSMQLQQEAAVVISMGGGFQTYYRQKPDCSINEWEMKIMSEVASFCRARQKVCHNAEVLPQIAVLCSGAAIYRKNELLFRLLDDLRKPMQGVTQCLLDLQYSVEVLIEHQLAGRMDEYPLIVVPEWDYIEPKFRKELLRYVENGGNLLAIGPKAASMFKKELQVSFLGKPAEKEQWLESDGFLCNLKTLSQSIKLKNGVAAYGKFYAENDTKGPHECAATITKYGKGKIAAIYTNLGQRYCDGQTVSIRDFVNGLTRKLFAKPIVEISGSHYVDVVVSSKKGKLLVNLVNTAGPHGNEKVFTYDELPVLGPLDIVIRTGYRPKKVTCVPGGRKLKYQYKIGEIRLTLPKLKLYDIIVVE